jgi:hypothetical protein
VQHLPGWATAEHAPVALSTRSQLVTPARLCNSRAGESAAAPVRCAKGVALLVWTGRCRWGATVLGARLRAATRNLGGGACLELTLVLDGGGVKGLGLAGAVMRLMEGGHVSAGCGEVGRLDRRSVFCRVCRCGGPGEADGRRGSALADVRSQSDPGRNARAALARTDPLAMSGDQAA